MAVPLSTLPTPYLMHEHTQSSFQTPRAGKQDGGEEEGHIRQTPVCVLTFPCFTHSFTLC